MAKSSKCSSVLKLALASFGFLHAASCFGLTEQDLSAAQPCKEAAPAVTAQAMQTFQRRYGEAYGTDWIDVNGDGFCDLVIGYQPSGAEHKTISEFFVVPGVRGGGLAQIARWRPSGDGANVEAVQVKGSPIPYLVTRTRDGFRRVLRWDPAADMSSKSAFRELGLQRGALLELSDDDRDARAVRRFLSRGYVSKGLENLRGEKYAAAVAALNEAGNIDSADAEINHHLGVVKSQAGAHADTRHERGASWYFSRALKQGIADPKSAQYRRALAPDTHLRLAKSYEATQNADAAIGAYRKYMALEPGAKRAQIENRIAMLQVARPVFEAPATNQRMAEEARKVRRLHLPVTPSATQSLSMRAVAAAVLKAPDAATPPPATPAPAESAPPTARSPAITAVTPVAPGPAPQQSRPSIAAGATQTPTQVASVSPRAIAGPVNVVKDSPGPIAAPDQSASIRRDLAAESEKQKRPLTPDQIEALVQYKIAHPDARIPDLVANPGAYATKPPVAIRGAPIFNRMR